jgi:hypothetical protein
MRFFGWRVGDDAGEGRTPGQPAAAQPMPWVFCRGVPQAPGPSVAGVPSTSVRSLGIGSSWRRTGRRQPPARGRSAPADEAVRRLAYEEGVRLYRAALALDPTSLPEIERCQLLVALGRAAYFASDLHACMDAAVAAADAARRARSPELMGEAALVLEAAPDPGVNAVAKQLCEQTLAGLGDSAHEALRARQEACPVTPSGCCLRPRCSRWRSAPTAPAPRCGSSSGGLTRCSRTVSSRPRPRSSPRCS